MPAFTANPTKNSPNSTLRIGPNATWPDQSVENERDPVIEAAVKNPAIRQPVATCDMTKYRYAARRLARSSCSVVTSAAFVSVINSHANRKAIASPAANTSSTAPNRRLNAIPMKAERSRRG
jgi:hypothetical protein